VAYGDLQTLLRVWRTLRFFVEGTRPSANLLVPWSLLALVPEVGCFSWNLQACTTSRRLLHFDAEIVL
jgi:hypothetical protein